MDRKSKRMAVMCRAGDITVKEGITCSDPCYKAGTWCSYTLNEGVSGDWSCYITVIMDREFGRRVSSLTLVRKGYEVKEALKERLSDQIGVDSGTCGFFDRDYYNDTHGENKEEWYTKNVCDNISYTSDVHKIADGGFWSNTAYGDGSYELYADYDDIDKDKVVRLTVMYDNIKPEVLYIADNEDEIVFPYSVCGIKEKILRYIKVLGKKSTRYMPYTDGKYTYDIDIIELKTPVIGKFGGPSPDKELSFITKEVRYNYDLGLLEVFGDYVITEGPYKEITFKDVFDFWHLDKESQIKILREIERGYSVDKDKIFYKKNEKDIDNTRCSR